MIKPHGRPVNCTLVCTALSTKGVIFTDLLWYLSDPTWPQPNLVLLNNALAQTHWPGEALTVTNWRERFRQHLRELNWGNIVTDVRPFVEPGFDVGLLSLENLERVLKR